MKHLLFISFLLFLSIFQSQGQNNAKLSRQLDSLYSADQYWRSLYLEVESGLKDTLSKAFIAKKSLETDSINYLAIQNIFDQFGYPNYDIVGDSSEHHFWLLVQHADLHPEFQQKVLEAMKVEVDKEDASKIDYAYLVDKIAVSGGRPQVYGTQVSFNKDKQSYEPRPVEDPDNLDKRRESIGLSPMAKFIQKLNDHYHGIKTPDEDEDKNDKDVKEEDKK